MAWVRLSVFFYEIESYGFESRLNLNSWPLAVRPSCSTGNMSYIIGIVDTTAQVDFLKLEGACSL
ncbi:uncharacterized protein Dvar_61560 [Desulfosarcina variabilis str. Montpellier]